MSTIFISYRRDDSAADMTDRIYERLVQRWGRRVFMDIDSLVGGDLFAPAIEKHLQDCAVVLVVIGRHWVSLTDEHGARRVDDPGDYPRMEVAAALRRGVRVVPVLVGNAVLPRADELPADIAALLERQVVHVSRERFDADMRQLIEAVAPEMHGVAWPPLASKFLGAAAVAVAAGAVWYFAGAGTATAPTEPSNAAAISKRDAPAQGDGKGNRASAAASVASPKAQPTIEPKAVLAQAEPPSAGASQRHGGSVQGTAGTDGKIAAPAKPQSAQVTAKAAVAQSPPNLTGDWVSTPINSAYSDYRFTLQFEFTQQEDVLLGTVFIAPLGSDRGFSTAIFDGRIKGNVVSFYTKGLVSGGPDGTYEPYKEMYVGTVVQGKRQIEFRRYNDVSTGGRTERFTATQKPP